MAQCGVRIPVAFHRLVVRVDAVRETRRVRSRMPLATGSALEPSTAGRRPGPGTEWHPRETVLHLSPEPDPATLTETAPTPDCGGAWSQPRLSPARRPRRTHPQPGYGLITLLVPNPGP